MVAPPDNSRDLASPRLAFVRYQSWAGQAAQLEMALGLFPAPLQFQIMALAQIPGWIAVVVLVVLFGPRHLARKSASREPSPSG